MKLKTIVTLLVGLSLYLLVDYIKAERKYDFTVTASAPRFYPSEIVNGGFSLDDGTILYIPSGSIMKTGWGGSGAMHIVGPELKSLPIGFSVTWISYVEKKFYQGEFTLDKALIEKYFQIEYRDEGNRKEKFDEFKVGVAPGGVVVLWISGIGRQVQIGRYQAKEVALSMKDFKPNAILSLDNYNKIKIKRHLPKALQNVEHIANIPFGLWDRYLKKYLWKPNIEFSNEKSKLEGIHIDYYNGEKIIRYSKPLESFEYRQRAIPKFIRAIWEDGWGNTFGAKVTLGNLYGSVEKIYVEMEKEIFLAFKAFGESTKIDLIVSIDTIEKEGNLLAEIKVFLDNGIRKIELKKIKKSWYKKENCAADGIGCKQFNEDLKR